MGRGELNLRRDARATWRHFHIAGERRHERLINTCDMHQVADGLSKTNRVVVKHLWCCISETLCTAAEPRNIFLDFAWQPRRAEIDSATVTPHQRRRRAGSFRQEEATMTLRMRLNVLAAIV